MVDNLVPLNMFKIWHHRLTIPLRRPLNQAVHSTGTIIISLIWHLQLKKSTSNRTSRKITEEKANKIRCETIETPHQQIMCDNRIMLCSNSRLTMSRIIKCSRDRCRDDLLRLSLRMKEASLISKPNSDRAMLYKRASAISRNTHSNTRVEIKTSETADSFSRSTISI